MNDFSKGPVWKNIVRQMIPLTLAQMVQILYNVVDRVYLGHLKGTGSMALTGVGLTFPIITLIIAFTALISTGGAPLFAMARGARDEKRARRIQGTCFFLLLGIAVVILGAGEMFARPILYLFGASSYSYVYASQYLRIYLLGTFFVMISVGMNQFINAQGFPKVGMLTTVIGALLNLILDPVFIFLFGLGVRGAAIATVISQGVSAFWVLRFLRGEKAVVLLTREDIAFDGPLTKRILALGASGFVMQATNGLVQIVCNTTLSVWGGDVYIGIMTVLNSIREILSLPVFGLTAGAGPVLSFNYGAKDVNRVRTGIKFTAMVGVLYTIGVWALIIALPHFWIRIFTSDPKILAAGVPALRIYFFGFCFMAFQFSGQTAFQSLGCARRAIFFSLLRKVFIVVPLTLLLPGLFGIGANGVFMAEPISNLIGGLACFTTMYFTVYRRLEDMMREHN